MEYLQV